MKKDKYNISLICQILKSKQIELRENKHTDIQNRVVITRREVGKGRVIG